MKGWNLLPTRKHKNGNESRTHQTNLVCARDFLYRLRIMWIIFLVISYANHLKCTVLDYAQYYLLSIIYKILLKLIIFSFVIQISRFLLFIVNHVGPVYVYGLVYKTILLKNNDDLRKLKQLLQCQEILNRCLYCTLALRRRGFKTSFIVKKNVLRSIGSIN